VSSIKSSFLIDSYRHCDELFHFHFITFNSQTNIDQIVDSNSDGHNCREGKHLSEKLSFDFTLEIGLADFNLRLDYPFVYVVELRYLQPYLEPRKNHQEQTYISHK